MSQPILWKIPVSAETDRKVRAFLDESSLPSEDLAAFVETAVLWRVMDHSVQTIKDRNADLDPTALEAEIDAAVRAVRGHASDGGGSAH